MATVKTLLVPDHKMLSPLKNPNQPQSLVLAQDVVISLQCYLNLWKTPKGRTAVTKYNEWLRDHEINGGRKPHTVKYISPQTGCYCYQQNCMLHPDGVGC